MGTQEGETTAHTEEWKQFCAAVIGFNVWKTEKE